MYRIVIHEFHMLLCKLIYVGEQLTLNRFKIKCFDRASKTVNACQCNLDSIYFETFKFTQKNMI